MYPILFNYKLITIGGYGLMLGIGFYGAFLLMERELKLMGKDPELAYKILLGAIPSGIVGSKMFHIFEHFDQFLSNPKGMIFSGAGLSAYGGFVMAFIVSFVIIKLSKENIMEIYDSAAIPMAFGYCLGRFGCHVAGDGDYGLVTTTFFKTAYPNGIVPTTAEVFPTPLFEVFFSFMVLAFLLNLRKRELATGQLFFTYLILNGIPRFLVEFIRLNPTAAFNFTQAQIVSIFFVLTGIIGIIITGRRKPAL
jgi:phosphatidylglycerol---prolipoprotein diacylglyceryl transferase